MGFFTPKGPVKFCPNCGKPMKRLGDSKEKRADGTKAIIARYMCKNCGYKVQEPVR